MDPSEKEIAEYQAKLQSYTLVLLINEVLYQSAPEPWDDKAYWKGKMSREYLLHRAKEIDDWYKPIDRLGPDCRP